MERRLAAIMASDVVGYSRLIKADEESTITALKALRADLIDPKIAEHHGRIVKLMGDGMLAEFASVVDAVRAAVETQTAVAEHNAGLPEDKRIAFRVGINLGDVVIDGNDIHGDGVNVAARLEGMAEPGGVCISGMVYDGVRDRIDVPFEDMGEQEVKNIDRPVQVWRWQPGAKGSAAGSTAANETLPLPDKPSIAVLPFDNMSGDPEQEYFSDGVAEDIITELSRYNELFVIARNSTFTYKGKAVEVTKVARELGVRYVLEGSVRRADKRVRVTAQLIEAETGNHIWAERYDRDLEDIFAVQDDITAVIVNTLLGKLTRREFDRALRKRPEVLDAYDHALRAWGLIQKSNPSDMELAIREAKAAIELDPGFAWAHAALAYAYFLEGAWDWVEEPIESLRRGYEAALRAIELDDDEAWGHAVLGMTDLWFTQNHERSIAEEERAVSLNPNDATFRGFLSNVLCLGGRSEEGLTEIEFAMRLNPHYHPIALHMIGRALLTLRRYGEALPHLERLVGTMPSNTNARAMLAACYAALDRIGDARTTVEAIAKISPSYTLREIPVRTPYKLEKDREHYLDLLRKAGLPE